MTHGELIILLQRKSIFLGAKQERCLGHAKTEMDEKAYIFCRDGGGWGSGEGRNQEEEEAEPAAMENSDKEKTER